MCLRECGFIGPPHDYSLMSIRVSSEFFRNPGKYLEPGQKNFKGNRLSTVGRNLTPRELLPLTPKHAKAQGKGKRPDALDCWCDRQHGTELLNFPLIRRLWERRYGNCHRDRISSSAAVKGKIIFIECNIDLLSRELFNSFFSP